MLFGENFVVDDITGHEMTHGVTYYTSGLQYEREPGAINESMSDIFGEFIDLSNGRGNDAPEVRWLIGEDRGRILRDMEDPTRLGHPDSMRSPHFDHFGPDVQCDIFRNDVCGVHTNSAVGNRAAVLITDGGQLNGYTVRGLGIDKAARLYYEIQLLLTDASLYRDLANALQQACSNLIGPGVTVADDCTQVRRAVNATFMNQTSDLGASSALVEEPGCTANVLPRNDDQSTGRVALPFPANFFGNVHNSLHVNNNGNVTFDAPLSTFTPFGLTTNIGTPIIAPFFADVDSRAPGSAEVTYGASQDGRTFCVNWDGMGIGYYGSHSDRLNRFQLLLVDRAGQGGAVSGDFDIVMNYDSINWETGDASGGRGGLGGFSGRVGYSAGTGLDGTFFELPGSGVNGAFLDANASTGLVHGNRESPQQPGRYVFRIRSGAAPVGGSVGGAVYEDVAHSDRALSGAFVVVCPQDDPGVGCSTSSTNAAGQYRVAGLQPGRYLITAFPPGTSMARPGMRGPITVANDTVLDHEDIVLSTRIPLPEGTTITNLRIENGIPHLDWRQELSLRTQACPGGSASYAIAQGDQVVRSGAMVEGPSGTYSATIAPLRPARGFARVTITVACAGGATEVIVFDVYIDPSGVVVDTEGRPIDGTTVTLHRSDAIAGPFTPVPDGSGIMSVANRNNPDVTRSGGHFGWDVLAGFYRVRAAKAGCTSPDDQGTPYVETPTLTIPPPVTDLRLVLACGNHPPTAPGLDDTTDEDVALTVPVLSTATDPDGDPLRVTSWTSGSKGTVTCTATGDCTYAPTADANGRDSFTYTVEDDRGGSATGTVQVTIRAVNDAPIAAFTADPVSGSAPLKVAFDASPSVDDEGITTYRWEFGDGSTGTGRTISHLYQDPGTYRVRLVVSDSAGLSSEETAVVRVTAPEVPCTINGTSGDDELHGTEGRDVICAGAGDDRVEALGGDDWVIGGPGNDVLDGGFGVDTIDGGEGNDHLAGGRDNDKLHGEEDDDLLLGNFGTDELFGGAGADRLEGGADNDLLVGGEGDDVLRGGFGADVLDARDGHDDSDGGPDQDECVPAGESTRRPCE
jgi:hypothetical protein